MRVLTQKTQSATMVDADTLDNYYRGIARAVLGEETS